MSIDTLVPILADNGSWILFLLVMLENLGIPGYPGGFTLPIIGAASRMGYIDLPTSLALSFTASSLTMVLVYLFGRFCGRWITHKLGDNPGFQKHYQRIQQLLEQYGSPAIFIVRLIPVVRIFGSITAGLLNMEWKRYCIYSLAGNLVYTVVAMMAGYYSAGVLL